MKLPKLNQKGITHILAPIAFIAVFAVIGSIVFLKSNAASLPCTANTYAIGVTSHCVGDIQKMLNGIDYFLRGQTNNGVTINSSQLAVDNVFGSQTQAKVKTFQKYELLTSDGTVGPKTWNKFCLYAHQWFFSVSSLVVMRTAFQAGADAGCTNKP